MESIFLKLKKPTYPLSSVFYIWMLGLHKLKETHDPSTKFVIILNIYTNKKERKILVVTYDLFLLSFQDPSCYRHRSLYLCFFLWWIFCTIFLPFISLQIFKREITAQHCLKMLETGASAERWTRFVFLFWYSFLSICCCLWGSSSWLGWMWALQR